MSKFNRVFAAGVLLAGLPMAALAQVNVNVQVTGADHLQCERRRLMPNFGSADTTGVDSIDRRRVRSR